MAKQIVWSRLAHNERLKILEYWIERTGSAKYSKKLNKLFNRAAELVSRYPRIGRKTEIGDIRIKIVQDYFLTYRESETSIEILTIWDTRRDPQKFRKML